LPINSGADRLLLAGVTIFGVFSLSTLLANGLVTLIAARFMTGLGLGAAMPAVIAYASDHSPEYMKKRAVGFIYCAIPIGGLLSGVVMQAGISEVTGGRFILLEALLGCDCTLALLFLPKSLPRLKSNSEPTAPKMNIMSGLFGKSRASTTLSLWIATFGTLLVMYLLLGWMPSLLGAMGLSKPEAQYVQMLLQSGSVYRRSRRRLLARQKTLVFNAGYCICWFGDITGSFWFCSA